MICSRPKEDGESCSALQTPTIENIATVPMNSSESKSFHHDMLVIKQIFHALLASKPFQCYCHEANKKHRQPAVPRKQRMRRISGSRSSHSLSLKNYRECSCSTRRPMTENVGLLLKMLAGISLVQESGFVVRHQFNAPAPKHNGCSA